MEYSDTSFHSLERGMVNSVHDYVVQGDQTQIKHWLSMCMDIDEPDAQGRSPAFVAVETHNFIMAKLILKHNANPNAPDKQKRYPIHVAVEAQNYKMCELLLSHKADPDKRTPSGENALSLLALAPGWDQSKEKVARLLLKHGCKATFTNTVGDSVLHITARQGHVPLCKILLQANASVDLVNPRGDTSLHSAVEGGNEELVRMLLPKTSKLLSRNKEGKTALQIAQEKAPDLVPLIEETKSTLLPWREIKPQGKWPVPRCNHSSSVYNNRWYIYGGENIFTGESSIINNDMHFLNGDTKEWRLLAPRGTSPPPLCKHTTLIFGTKLYLFGGFDGEKAHNDVWVLDLDKMVWAHEEISGPYVIRPRFGHTMTAISGTQFIVFGGSSGKDYFNDIHLYDITTKKWERIDSGTPGCPPPKRYLHTATYCEGHLYVFGGNNAQEYFNDVFMLAVDSWSWFELEVNGIIPLARCGQSSLLINNSVILFYGGVDADNEMLVDIRCLDLRSYTWIKYDTSSSRNHQGLYRAGHSMEIIGTAIYVFGGNSMFCLHELLPKILDLQAQAVPDTVQEEKKKAPPKPPIPEKPTAPTPSSLPTSKEHVEKLQQYLQDLITLVKDSALPHDHPLHQKCTEIDAYLVNSSPNKPTIPEKPVAPPKPPAEAPVVVVKKATGTRTTKSGQSVRKRAPRPAQHSLPSVVLEELSTQLNTGSPFRGARRGMAQRPAGPVRGAAPRGRGAPTPPPTRTPQSPVRKIPPSLPTRPGEEGKESPGLSQKVRVNRGGGAVDRSNMGPATPPRNLGLRSTMAPLPPQRKERSNTVGSIRTPPPSRKVSAPSPGLNRAHTETQMLPSLMIAEEEEEVEEETNPEEEPIHKMAHTQPTQYLLPPPPENPKKHYEQLVTRIPTREKVVRPDLVDKKERMHYEIVNEILTTEESYLRDLAVLIGLFKKPLEQEYEGCIPSHYVDLLFSNVDELFEVNLNLFQQLLEAEKRKQSVGMAFMRVINLFPQYNTYCTNQRNASETAQKLEKINKSFDDFTKLMEAMEECQRQDIHSFLIKPFQRVTRYPLLLKELQKHTSKSVDDQNLLGDAIERIDAIVKEANEEKRVNDSVIKMIEIQKAFEWQGQEGQLKFSPDCKFLFEAKFKEYDAKSQKLAKRHFFLFNDMILIAKEVGKKYKKLSVIPIDKCIIWDIKAGSSEVPKSTKAAFSIVRTDKVPEGTSGKLIMCAKTPTDKELWISSINSAIASFIMTPETK